MRVQSFFLAALLSALSAAVMLYSQGMAGATRAPRPTTKIDTDLPPITVAFRDVAAAAGLTAVTVSGGKDRKKYILESTGPGVAIFDYDNDGLPDLFAPGQPVVMEGRFADDADPVFSLEHGVTPFDAETIASEYL